MSVVAFDTHKFVKRLQEAGFSEPQAEAVTLAVQEAASIDLTALATKDQLSRLEVAAATKQDLAETKVEILKWLIGLIGFQTIAVLGGVAALIKLIH